MPFQIKKNKKNLLLCEKLLLYNKLIAKTMYLLNVLNDFKNYIKWLI